VLPFIVNVSLLVYRAGRLPSVVYGSPVAGVPRLRLAVAAIVAELIALKAPSWLDPRFVQLYVVDFGL